MNGKDFGKLMIGAAVAGLISGGAAFASDGGKKPAKKAAKAHKASTKAAKEHACKGMNECKGKGGCKTADNSCKGKNACKGKGGCSTAMATPKKADEPKK
ncbi:MAG: hypothetical protein JST20_06620 [Bacteroidetes bacterium]|nr:hypothetical protein [Bacteroidota bacterium]